MSGFFGYDPLGAADDFPRRSLSTAQPVGSKWEVGQMKILHEQLAVSQKTLFYGKISAFAQTTVMLISVVALVLAAIELTPAQNTAVHTMHMAGDTLALANQRLAELAPNGTTGVLTADFMRNATAMMDRAAETRAVERLTAAADHLAAVAAALESPPAAAAAPQERRRAPLPRNVAPSDLQRLVGAGAALLERARGLADAGAADHVNATLSMMAQLAPELPRLLGEVEAAAQRLAALERHAEALAAKLEAHGLTIAL